MAADFRFVVNAAEADAHEFAAHRAGDRLAERGLADAGRPDEAQDRRLAVRRELAHGEIFDDAALDLFEAEMVLVEDAPRRRDVDRLLLGQRPGQFDQPIEIGPHHAVFARRLRHALQAAQLLARLVVDLLRHLGLGDRLARVRRSRPPCPRRLRRAGAGSPPSARAAALRGCASRATPCVSRPISCDSRSTSIRCASRRETRSIRAPRSDRLQDLLLLFGRRVHVGRDHVGEQRRRFRPTGSPRASSCGVCGRSCRASIACPLRMHETRLDVGRDGVGSAPGCARRGDEERPAGQDIRRSGTAARPGRRDDARRPAR